MSRWRLGLWLLAGAAYALACHWLMLHAADRPWAVAVLLGPLLLAGAGIAAQQRQAWVLAGLAVAAAALAWVVWRGGVGSINRLYLLQHTGIHLAMGVTFALTLRRGQRLSFIGRLAEHVHGRLTPAKVAYTRRVTVMWAAYFLGMAALSLWVYRALDWAAWSLLANLITPAAIGLLFVGEYLARYRLHPEFERKSIAETLQAYRR